MRLTPNIILATIFITIYSTNVFAEENLTKVRADIYGVQISLPESRWEMVNLSKKNKPKDGKLRFIASAKDKKNAASVRVAAMNIDGSRTLKQWVEWQKEGILDWYNEKYKHSIVSKSDADEVIGSGETVHVEYMKLKINGNDRNVAFVSFAHNNHYFITFVWNTGVHKEIGGFVEDKLLANLLLF